MRPVSGRHFSTIIVELICIIASKFAVFTHSPVKLAGNVHLAGTVSVFTGISRNRSGPSWGDFSVLHSAVIETDKNWSSSLFAN